ncbi:MAG TPA: cupin domain-containing protein [Bacteroidales bacterium]|nr:cupin domain-containing protein [Bacteroidales bacterium]
MKEKIFNFFHYKITNRSIENYFNVLNNDTIRIERIISFGQQSPPDFWYDQDENEWILLLKGKAKLEFIDRKITLNKGDSLLIPAHEKHRVAYTHKYKPTIWLAVFFKSKSI